MRFEEKLRVSKEEVEMINHYLHDEPKDASACLGEDETIIHTVSFENGIEMDIKCCGVQFEEVESNLAWTEAVLFKNGSEVCCTEASDEYLGEWILEYNGDEYVVKVLQVEA